LASVEDDLSRTGQFWGLTAGAPMNPQNSSCIFGYLRYSIAMIKTAIFHVFFPPHWVFEDCCAWLEQQGYACPINMQIVNDNQWHFFAS